MKSKIPPKPSEPLSIRVRDLLIDERFRFIFGLFSFFFSAFLALAFISYLFTWRADQSMLDNGAMEFFTNSSLTVENMAGKMGAALANLFIHDWFGIASFSFVFILVIMSFRLINIELLPFGKTLKLTTLATIWLSITLGFFAGDNFFYLGGAYGYFISEWIISVLGNIGTFFVILITLVGFIIFNFEGSLAFVIEQFKALSSQKTVAPQLETQPVTNKKADNFDEQFKSDFKKSEFNEDFDREFKRDFKIKENDRLDDLGHDEIEFKATSPTSRKTNINDVVEKHEFVLGNNGKISNDSLGFEVESTLNIEESVMMPTAADDEDYNGLLLNVELNKDILVDNPDENMPLEDYDPTLELSSFKMPLIDLLEDHKIEDSEVSNEELVNNKNKIVETLKHYKIEIKKIKATIGPTITLYEIIPAPGVRISRIKNLEDDIALSLSALGIRIIAPMPGRGTIGIEVPNQKPEIVSMRSIITSAKFQESKFELPVALGKTISNESYVVDLTKMPHLLVAGATGQGKSVGLNAIITSLLFKKHPSQLKFVLIDPKKVELTLYEKLERHYLATLPDSEEAIITDNHKVVETLSSLNREMDNRYDLLKKAQVRNIKEYNVKFIARKLNPNKGHKYLPYIVLIIDEFADLIMTAGKEVELPIARLAQLARAIGIHLIVATQRPSTNIITGVIKANFPTRIAFKVASMIDSRTILDSPGANQLIGRGDMLITQGSDLIRLQCAFIDTPEIDRITDYIGTQRGYVTAHMLPEVSSEGETNAAGIDMDNKDDLFEDAARLIVVHQQGSTSLIQRKMAIGYNRAGRIMDQLEAAGIVGPFEGSKARQVLYTDEYSLEQYLNVLNGNAR
ncbi:MAG TPA: cell division protein FtsK [Bacteroidales bacterium]|nr:cell division protein FtsK [Bacteroidales bacterium]